METFSALLALRAGNSPVTSEFPAERPVTRSLFSLICAWINGWVNNRKAGDLRRHRAHYDVTVMWSWFMQKANGVAWCGLTLIHDDIIKWKHYPRYWPFVRGIHRSTVNSPHKGQWRGALMFTSICTRINGWVNNHEAGGLRRHRGHYDVSVMFGPRLTLSWYPDCVPGDKLKVASSESGIALERLKFACRIQVSRVGWKETFLFTIYFKQRT